MLDRRPVSPLSFSPTCSGAGSGWHLRTQIADSTVYLGGPATVGAGPLMCADSWAVTLWRIASAARLRRSRGHRTERGQPAWQSLILPISMAPLRMLSRPSWRPGRAGPLEARPRAVTELVCTVRVSHSPRPLHSLANGPSSARHFGLLTSGRTLQTRMRARGAGSRGHHDQRSRYATSRLLAPLLARRVAPARA